MMRKIVLSLLFSGFLAGITPFANAQRLSSVGIHNFNAGSGGAPADAANLTRLIIEELSSWGTLIVLTGAQADDAEYVIKGNLSRSGSNVVLAATTIEKSSGKTLNESKEQAPNANSIPVFVFCTKLVENVPYPNYLLGKWQSTISLPDSQVSCIIEFKTNRIVEVVQYETWEHRQNNVLKYEGYGSGTYGYAGHQRRLITLQDGRGASHQITVDATVSVNLKIEEALTEYSTISQGGIRLLFDDARNSFEIVWGGLPCGRNYDGPSVYPSERLFFTKFTKIR